LICCGRPSKLTDEQKGNLKEILNERDDRTTKEVGVLIKEKL